MGRERQLPKGNNEYHVCQVSGHLFAFVRASLWQTPVDPQFFISCTPDWEAIGTLAMRHTIAILTIESAINMPPPVLPPSKAWLQKACSYSLRNLRTHSLLDTCVAEATALLQSEGLIPVLLKGQAYARYYPRPELRQCGDIDLYVGEEAYRHICETVHRLGWDGQKQFFPTEKHYGCYLHGVHIELHRIAARLPLPGANRRFQAWSRCQLSSSLRHINVGGKDIAIPSPLFDVIFVFLHMYHHFINSGVGLRHLCDWVMLLHAHKDEIDSQELQELLRSFHLLRAWRIFTPIAVHYLGLPETECPFYSAEYSRKSDRVLTMILREGNFGRYVASNSKPPRSLMHRKLRSLFHYSHRSLLLFPLDSLTVTAYYCGYIYRGTKRILKEL